jgi:uncharacterized caspase-like protein
MFSHGYALIIGVHEYVDSGLRDLPASLHDAERITSVLTDSTLCAYSPVQVRTVTRDQTTLKGIRTALADLATQTTSESTVVVYYSGHGGRGVAEDGALQTFLCTRQTNLQNLEDTALARNEFSALLEQIPARKMLILLDCCYAAGAARVKGEVAEQVRWKSGLTEVDVQLLAQGSGRAVIASSEQHQQSWATPQVSVFTEYIIQGLQGAAGRDNTHYIGVLDLFNYVAEQVPRRFSTQKPVLHAAHLDQNFPISLYLGGTKSLEGIETSIDNIPAEPVSSRPSTGTLNQVQMKDNARGNVIQGSNIEGNVAQQQGLSGEELAALIQAINQKK